MPTLEALLLTGNFETIATSYPDNYAKQALKIAQNPKGEPDLLVALLSYCCRNPIWMTVDKETWQKALNQIKDTGNNGIIEVLRLSCLLIIDDKTSHKNYYERLAAICYHNPHFLNTQLLAIAGSIKNESLRQYCLENFNIKASLKAVLSGLIPSYYVAFSEYLKSKHITPLDFIDTLSQLHYDDESTATLHTEFCLNDTKIAKNCLVSVYAHFFHGHPINPRFVDQALLQLREISLQKKSTFTLDTKINILRLILSINTRCITEISHVDHHDLLKHILEQCLTIPDHLPKRLENCLLTYKMQITYSNIRFLYKHENMNWDSDLGRLFFTLVDNNQQQWKVNKLKAATNINRQLSIETLYQNMTNHKATYNDISISYLFSLCLHLVTKQKDTALALKMASIFYNNLFEMKKKLLVDALKRVVNQDASECIIASLLLCNYDKNHQNQHIEKLQTTLSSKTSNPVTSLLYWCNVISVDTLHSICKVYTDFPIIMIKWMEQSPTNDNTQHALDCASLIPKLIQIDPKLVYEIYAVYSHTNDTYLLHLVNLDTQLQAIENNKTLNLDTKRHSQKTCINLLVHPKNIADLKNYLFENRTCLQALFAPQNYVPSRYRYKNVSCSHTWNAYMKFLDTLTTPAQSKAQEDKIDEIDFIVCKK